MDGKNWGYYNGFCYNEIEEPYKWAYIKDIIHLSSSVSDISESEEPVSEDLEKEVDKYISDNFEGDEGCVYVLRCARYFANWQKYRLIRWLSIEAEYLLKEGRVNLAHQYRGENYKEIIAKLKDM
jgi:hypothetical protein